ncbi:fumarylacetoacetate hydrolase family protein [Paenibacillus guangzhouensis]|uniref:fumarylacetoacetate hydrolase family protein n=1 Tax=Paenibacillus guangzhouensis TaxID=1473112 RepID=UPI0012673935|nr:fumarylacetoacetate hydrolase family protein [Paenibacillus guangzhouensis]
MQSMIQNVYCVGRNYRLHAAELGNEVPTKPMIFMKPTHAVVPMNGEHITMPKDQGELHYEAELVIRIGRDYEPGMSMDDLIDVMALGIDFTLRDVQTVCKQKGHPWTAAKAFRNSAPITPYIAFPGVDALPEHDFVLLKNGVEVQRGNARDMIFDVKTIVDFVAMHYGIGKGDIIFTGTPAGVGAAVAGDKLELFYGDNRLDSCIIA